MTTISDADAAGFRRSISASTALAPLLVLLVTACGGGDPSPGPGAPALDPTRVAPGDTLLGLRIVSIDARPERVDSFGWSGEARFIGPVTLSGEYRPHPEAPDVEDLCFFPDSASAARLPRFPNDTRYSWLCFRNSTAARTMLQPTSGEATIVVDSFRYLYEHTDSYNTAHLDSVLDAERLQ